MQANGGVPAILYDFNACDDFVRRHYRVIQNVYIPSAQIGFNATQASYNPIRWHAFRCDGPLRQQTGDPLLPAEIPLNAREITVPEELIKALQVYVQAEEKVDADFAALMLQLTSSNAK